MHSDFWQDKWQNGRIGFNQTKPNDLLIANLSTLNLPQNSTIFVPLCGKSIDMVWLTKQGLNVVGIELVEQAVIDFFNEHTIQATEHAHPKNPHLKYYQGNLNNQVIKIWVGDIFDLTANEIGLIVAVYDRAALVALPDDGTESLRQRYVKKVQELTETASQLLLNFTVNEDVLDEHKGFDKKTFGPPFIIEADTLRSYYQDVYTVKFLAKNEANTTDVLINQAWLLTPKH